MKKKSSLMLDDEFIRYCEINKIDDVEALARKIFQRGFTIEKYGEVPMTAKPIETIIEKKVTVEVIKEVPVDRIVYQEKIVEIPVEKIVEVIKEVQVEKIVEVIKEVAIETKGDERIITKEIIKEVPVEKIVEVVKEVIVEKYVTDNTEIKRLQDENKKLNDELNQITTTLEKMNKAKYLKGSDLNDLYDE
jgi:hypothetical protein